MPSDLPISGSDLIEKNPSYRKQVAHFAGLHREKVFGVRLREEQLWRDVINRRGAWLTAVSTEFRFLLFHHR
jgi:hypothetical protein